MKQEELQQIAVCAAVNAGLDPALVCALIAHESDGWKPYAIRYEPAFYSRYIEKMVGLSQTEKTLRACSMGLMQIMGQVARELGFDEEFLTELLDPLANCKYGCRRLARAMDKENRSVHAALLNYNGGGNANYPDLVMKHYPDYAYLNVQKS